MNEQILIKLGLDSSPLTRGMAGLKGVVTRAAQSIGQALSGGFGALIGGGAVVAGLHKAIELADQLKSTSESLNVSTDFLQGFQRFAQDNGASIESANKALIHLSRLVGEAASGSEEAIKKLNGIGVVLRNENGTLKDTGEIVLEIADKFKDASSGAEQSRIAFEGLGKSGIILAAGMRQGSAAMQEFINKVPKLTQTQINALDELGDRLQAFGADSLVAAVDTSSAAGLIMETFARARREGISPGEAAKRIRSEAQAAYDATKKRFELQKTTEASSAFEKEREDARLAMEKADSEWRSADAELKQTAAEKEKTELLKAQRDFKSDMGRLDKAAEDRGRFTLGELANLQAGPGGFTRAQWVNKNSATRAVELEEQGRWWLSNNNDVMAKRRFSAADAIRAGLTPLASGERKPFAELEKSAHESADTLLKLEALFRETGVKVDTSD